VQNLLTPLGAGSCTSEKIRSAVLFRGKIKARFNLHISLYSVEAS